MQARLLPLVIVAILCIVPEAAVAQGCAMCKAVVENGETGVFGGQQKVGEGLNTGILYLMAVPYMLLFLLFRKRIVSFVKELSGAQG